MRAFIKIMLIFALTLFALFNYHFITFDHGISKPSMDDKNALEALKTLSEVDSVKYYKKTIVLKSDSESSEEIYRVYISTNDAAYLLDATQDDIDAFDMLSMFNDNLQPKKITPIPFYVEVVLGLIILILPFGRRKKAK